MKLDKICVNNTYPQNLFLKIDDHVITYRDFSTDPELRSGSTYGEICSPGFGGPGNGLLVRNYLQPLGCL